MTTSALDVIAVVGAGAMGAGIAQVAAAHGHRVLLADAQPAALARARDGLAKTMAREVEKQRLTGDAADALMSRITYVDGTTADAHDAFGTCGMVIEAIIENLAAKQELLRTLERVMPRDAIIATNTSSLSIAALAGACTHSDRVIGVHFFNPAPVMALVEIVPAITTSAVVTARARTLVDTWGKTTVLASDTPGFIVNRIARPYYGEAIRLLDEGIADCATIDWAMRELGRFRMGPFELMDFIGHDVNFAVTRSVFDATFFDPRYRPSTTQQRLVESGLLGRKSSRGFHDYRDGAVATQPTRDHALGQQIVDRILAMLINEAVDALHLGIASAADIELSMTTGVNYPKGLLAWGDAIGATTVLARLDALYADYGDDRYRASVRLRRVVRDGGTLL